MWYVLAPVGLVVLLLLLVMWFMLGGDPLVNDQGSTGAGVEATTGDDDPPGLFDADDTRDEIEFRGLGGAAQGTPGALTMGEQVTLDDVAVAGVQGENAFSIEHRGERVMVDAPQDAPAVRAGMRVNVIGRVESDGRGGMRIRATRVEAR